MLRSLVFSAVLLACASAQAVTTQLANEENPTGVGSVVVTTTDSMGNPAMGAAVSFDCGLAPNGEDFPCARALYQPVGVGLADALTISSVFETQKAVNWFQFEVQVSPFVFQGDMPEFTVTFEAVDLDTSEVLFSITLEDPYVIQNGGQYLYRNAFFLDPLFTGVDDVHSLSMVTTITPIDPLDPGAMPTVTHYGALIATVPEPETYALMLVGLGAVALRRRAHA